MVLGTAWKQGWDVRSQTVESLPPPPDSHPPGDRSASQWFLDSGRLKPVLAPSVMAGKVELSPIRPTWTFCFFFFNFYWSLVAFQYCVSFYCTAKWISHTYPLFLGFPSHLGHHRALNSIIFIYILYIVESGVYMSVPVYPISPFPLVIPLCSLCLCLYFCFINKILCTIFFSDSTYMC